jgi:uncharacterized membrane protein YvbJ
MPYCHECGAELSIDDVFCSKCGIELDREKLKIEEPIPPKIAWKNASKPKEEEKRKGKSKG